MLCAEKRCARRKRGYAWSPKLKRAGEIVRYWKHVHSLKRVGRELSRWAREVRNKYGLQDGALLTEVEALGNLKSAWADLRELQQKAVAVQEEFLVEQAKVAASQNDLTVESAIKCILRQEAQKQLWQKIGRVTRANRTGALSRLLIPDPDDPNSNRPKQCEKWLEIDDSEEIHTILLDRNSKTLNAAHGMPPTVGPIADILGRHGEGADAFLDGELPVEDLDEFPEIIQWLKDAQHTPATRAMPPLLLVVSPRLFWRLVRKTSEWKSSSPLERHYEHYKAVVDNKRLISLHASMASLPFQHGFSHPRWENIVDFMLEKDAGVPKIHRLQIIVLLEGDL